MDHSSDRPIIVIGCARSGTTLLQSMIHAHARLAMPPENRFMMPLYRERNSFGDLRVRRNVEALGQELTRKGTKIHDLGLDKEAVRERLYRVPATIGSMLGSVLVAYAEKHGRERWGDKRPNYVQFIDRIMELFPDAQIVQIIRDGRDSAASLLTMPWWEQGYHQAVYKWRDAVEAGNRAREYGPDAYYELRYEDLVADPETTLKGLCTFLDEDFDQAMLEPHRLAGITPEYKIWHEALRRPVNESAVRRWNRDLSLDQVTLFELVAGDQLRQHGYEITQGGREPSASMLADWEATVTANEAREQRREQAERARARHYSHPVAAALTSRQRELADAQGWLADYDR